jgi:hypothetical protein
MPQEENISNLWVQFLKYCEDYLHGVTGDREYEDYIPMLKAAKDYHAVEEVFSRLEVPITYLIEGFAEEKQLNPSILERNFQKAQKAMPHEEFNPNKKKDLGLGSENKNRRKNGPDTPETAGVPDVDKVSPHSVFSSPDLGDHILDLYEDYKKNGDPALLEIIKNYSKHIGQVFSKHTLEGRLARRKLANKLSSENIFGKIPQRKAQDANNTGDQNDDIKGVIPDLQQTRAEDKGRFVGEFPNAALDATMTELKAARDRGNITASQFDNLVKHSNAKIKSGFQQEFTERKGQAPAMNPPAQMSYSYTTGTPPAQPSASLGTMGNVPAKPTTPAPVNKKWVFDQEQNRWMLVPINQETTV